MSMLTVPQADGSTAQLKMLSTEEIDALVNDNSPQTRKSLMDHMKALGGNIAELVRMTAPKARKEFILERYKEYGGAANGKAKAKAGTNGLAKGLTAGKAKPAATATSKVATGKPAAAKAAAKEPEEEEEETEEGAAAEGTSSEAIEELKAQNAELLAKIDILTEGLGNLSETTAELAKFVLESHAILRAVGPTAAGLDEGDVIELAKGAHATLALEFEEEEEGN